MAKVENGQLMTDLLQGAVNVYYDRRYDKEQLEAAINENLETLRQKYPKQSMKNLEGNFQDLLKLFNQAEGRKGGELNQLLKRDCGVPSSAFAGVVEAIETIQQSSSGSAAAAQLLKKVHYSQLINFDFKFAITTADSHIQQNGKCFIHLKMDLLNERNEREAVYTELTLE